MTSRIFLNKKGNTLIFQSVIWFIMGLGFLLLTQAMKHDGYFSDYVESDITAGEEPSLTDTGFFTNRPVFIGLPSWVLTIYTVFATWGFLLVMAWIRGSS